jgi:hypothetical protein
MSPARLATLVALPVALVVGIVVYFGLKPSDTTHQPAAGSPAPSVAANSAPVTITASPLAGRPTLVCRALLARLPDRLGDLTRRPVTAGAEQNAAYGDPPVSLSCGVPGPSAAVDAQFLRLSGICWYASPAADDTVWSLLGREVPLRVNVPNRYEGQLLIGLSAAIGSSIAESGSDPCAHVA